MTDTILSAIALTEGQPEASFHALYERAKAEIGCKLFTCIRWDIPGNACQRAYTNMSAEFGPDEPHPITPSPWGDLVLKDQQKFISNDIEGLRWAFTNADYIQSVGCESIINTPVIVKGQVIGTYNLLHEAGYFTEERIAATEALLPYATACFLLQRAMMGAAI